jgi:spore photoproduct lyase
MIHYPDWEKGYQDLVDQILDAVPSDRIAWISLGTLRYISSLKSVVDERFPKSRVFLGEFVPGEDGKMRYLKKIRQRLFRNVQQRIEKLAPQIPTYLCMENSSLWEKTMPYQPQTAPDVEEKLAVSFRDRFPMEA